jgi:4-diphosphocytidyl-2-C-methyl-D-erythritol kinase
VIGAAFAPAKVNLFLHIGPLAADGFHPVCSLMVFADVGDRLRLERGGGFAVEGPFAAELAGLGPADNLVMRAARALGEPPGRLVLDKQLPVASGLGGGSSDAGAALRLLRAGRSDAELEAAAAALGSDGVPCLWARPVIAEGRGERLSPAPRLPLLHAVLVNPRAPCPTGAVYRAYDAGPAAAADRPASPEAFADAAAVVSFLERTRNDLEAPAAGLVPLIADTLAWLRARPEVLFARLSGSGATCFALCEGAEAAARLAVDAEARGWWAKACRLGGPWPEGPLSQLR